MEFIPLLALGALVYKFVDFLKYAKAQDWNGVFTQLITWVSGIGAVALFAASGFAGDISVFNGLTLADAGLAEQVILGLTASSVFSAGYDLKKAVDNTDSAATPSLFE